MGQAMRSAMSAFSRQMEFLTGSAPRESDTKFFVERVETEAAFVKFPQVISVQMGVMMERTVSGRAEMIEVQINTAQL